MLISVRLSERLKFTRTRPCGIRVVEKVPVTMFSSCTSVFPSQYHSILIHLSVIDVI